MEERKVKHIIIAGSNRSGTTSLFHYLSHHPEINPSKVKQTNFFLSMTHYHSKKVIPINYSDDIHAYSDLFHKSVARFEMEASPDYLYSKGTAIRIRNYLNCPPKLIFLLREPNDRMKSWFGFGKQIGEVPEDQTYSEFISKCLSGDNGDKEACLLYTSPSPRDKRQSRMPSSA